VRSTFRGCRPRPTLRSLPLRAYVVNTSRFGDAHRLRRRPHGDAVGIDRIVCNARWIRTRAGHVTRHGGNNLPARRRPSQKRSSGESVPTEAELARQKERDYEPGIERVQRERAASTTRARASTRNVIPPE